MQTALDGDARPTDIENLAVPVSARRKRVALVVTHTYEMQGDLNQRQRGDGGRVPQAYHLTTLL